MGKELNSRLDVEEKLLDEINALKTWDEKASQWANVERKKVEKGRARAEEL